MGKSKTVLIILALIAFLTVGVLLVAKIGNIGSMGASITYDTNGCPKDGNKWTYDTKTNKCTAYANPTYECSSGYKWSSGVQKCYKVATRVNNNYQCFNGDTKLTNNRYLGNGTYCTRNKDQKVCKVGASMPSNASAVLDGSKCKFMVTAKQTKYTATFNANGGSTPNTSKITKKAGEKLGTLPNTTRKGYIFDGWYTAKTGGTKISSSTTMQSKNVTYYAHWKSATITDAAFNKCVINSYNKEKGAHYASNYQLTSKQLSTLKTVTCTDNNMKDLYGIANMTSLTTLTLGSDNLYKVPENPDFSKNTKLEYLTITKGKYITALDLSKNTKLKKLSLSNMGIEKIVGLDKLKSLYSITLYNLPELGRYDSHSAITSIKFQTIHRTPHIQGYSFVKVDGIEGLYSLYASNNTKVEKLNSNIDVYDVYQSRATTTGKTSATVVYSINKNAKGAKITRVEYKSKKSDSWKLLSKTNLTYNSDGSATIKFTKSQTVYLRITTNDGVSREVGYYNINITGDN